MLTPSQMAAIKADILAAQDMAGLPANSDGSFEIARLYNLEAAPAYYVWQTAVPIDAITDAIVWANMTPAQAIDNTAGWTNRALACQGKQFNLQNLLIGRTTINAAKSNIRAGLQDSLTAIPSAANGSLQGAGWAAVQLALSRPATRLEKLLAVGAGTQANPGTMTYEGSVSFREIDEARNS